MLNFLGIGAQKSGTTWLYSNLQKHPEIDFPGHHKELHFWNKHRARGLEWYDNLFKNNDVINGEITPAYAILPVEAIAEIHQNYPDLKLIFMHRNPIERAWSSAKMGVGFSDMQLDEASDQWFIDHFHSSGSRARGDYEACLKNWMSFYSPKQLMVIDFDILPQKPLEILNSVANFVGAKNIHFNDKMLPDVQQKVFEGNGSTIREQLKPVLSNLYRDKIASFERYVKELEQSGCQRF